MQVTGNSKIPVINQVVEDLIQQLLGKTKEEINLDVRFDSRTNVRSSFGKFTPGETPEIRMYTGCIATVWDTIFKTSDGFMEDIEVLIFFLAYFLKKYLRQTPYEVTTNRLEIVKTDEDYKELKANFTEYFNFYKEKAAAAVALKTPVQRASKAQKEQAPEVAEEIQTAEGLEDVDLL